jgi:hypothetical protein
MEVSMRAIVINGFGGLDSLVIETRPDPEPKAGHAVIEVKAFGINHACSKQNPQKFSSSTISGTRMKRWSQTSLT